MKKFFAYALTLVLLVTQTLGYGGNSNLTNEKMPSSLNGDYADTVLSLINMGDRKVLNEITYLGLDYVLDTAMQKYQGQIPFKNRDKIVNSALSGLFNKDPRVILICIELLRVAGPDYLMLPEAKELFKQTTEEDLISFIKTKENWLSLSYNDIYEYRNLNGKKVKKSLTKEVSKFCAFVYRDNLLKEIQVLSDKGNILVKMKKGEFYLLSQRIDEEQESEIPFRSIGKKKIFRTTDLNFIIEALDQNPSIDIKREIAQFLIDYYNYNIGKLEDYQRSKILSALKRAYDNSIIDRPQLAKY